MERDLMRRGAIVGGAVLVAGLLLILCVWLFIGSTHPDKKVREGTVVAHKFVPAHDHHYLQPVYTGQTCITIGSGTNQTQSCTSHYIYVPQTDHIPDAWFIKVEGCKRYKADSPLDYCQKKATRTIGVDETDYHRLGIGAKWTEAP